MSRLSDITSRIQSADEALFTVKKWKDGGEKVVFTNGCFDILHKGHVAYLAASSDLGTKLVVGLNTDSSVKRQGKGEERPVNPEDARALLIAALGFVDLVVFFDSDTPIELIKELLPSVLVKGADYDAAETDLSSKKYIQGREEVLAAGGEVKTIDLVPGFSTTSIIAKLNK